MVKKKTQAAHSESKSRIKKLKLLKSGSLRIEAHASGRNKRDQARRDDQESREEK